MKRSVLGFATILAISSCSAPGHRSAESPVIRPDQVKDFAVLFARNCAGCHGSNGQNGVAVPIGNPVYLAVADDATIRRVASEGRPGTAMAPFAQENGGMLTDAQIDLIVSGIRQRWGKPGVLGHTTPPAYAAQGPGDAKHGQQVFSTACSVCHGKNGSGGPAGSIVDASFLTLVSDQHLRITVIVGIPALGMPDWRGHAPKPLTDEDVSDVVAWLTAQRSGFSNLTELNLSGGVR
jgi:mono/diheme cytochrome c family protein